MSNASKIRRTNKTTRKSPATPKSGATRKIKKNEPQNLLIVDGMMKSSPPSHREGFDIHYASSLNEASRLSSQLDQCLVLGTLTAEKKGTNGTNMDGITKISRSLQAALTTVQGAISSEADRLVRTLDRDSDQLDMISNVNKSLQEALSTVYETMNKESDRLEECGSAINFTIKPFEDPDLAARLRGLLSSPMEVAEIQEEKLRLESLVSIIQSVLSTLNISDIRSLVVTKLAEAIQTKDCSVVQLKQDHDECFVLESAKGLSDSELKLSLNKYPELKKVLHTKEPLAIKNMLAHPLMKEVRDSIKHKAETCSMVIPIVFDDPVLGTEFLKINREGAEFSEDEMKLCNAVAEASLFAMKNAIVREGIQKEKDRFLKLATITEHLSESHKKHSSIYKRFPSQPSSASRYGYQKKTVISQVYNRLHPNKRPARALGLNERTHVKR